MSEDIAVLKSFLPLINIVVVILSGLVVFSIKGIEENAKKVLEVRLLKTHLQQIENLLKVLQTQKHEHTRHIQTIQAMLYLDEERKAREYIDGIVDNYWHTDDIVYIGNPAFTALINTKRKVAESKGIDFAVAVKCDINKISVEPWDLCSIMGNLIDNAIEATIQDNNNQRVSVEIKYENNSFVIYVHNSGPRIQDKENIFKAGYTTKGSEARGYGLYLVAKLVKKYNGNIEVISDKKTSFIVCIPDKDAVANDKGSI
ncbi:sensor histidine kinase [Desulfofalx alkaliphila]|uniref:sensor histidine kinase n=1 Tax=Desulfofalx alkaliphila TaxID=105483 RepID=UPI001A9A67EF|nr:GHKL domain-containing protein [Desulfofalx alkaliphila]